jgi:hypothetical protein
MKTSLPPKFPPEQNASWDYINKLIDYLAELTEVVNNKQDMIITSGQLGKFAGFERDETPVFKGLKETLLEEIRNNMRHSVGQSIPQVDIYNEALSDVTSIINRLMP